MIGKTLGVSVLAAVVILAGASISPGLNVPIPNDEKWNDPRAPEAYNRIVNRYERVYGFAGSDVGSDFYFKGDIEQLNAFLSQLAEAKNTILICTLAPGPGFVEPSFPLGEENKPPPIAYTWAVHMPRRLAEAEPPAPEQEPAQDAAGKQPGHDQSQNISVAETKWACGDLLEVVVPVHGTIELDKLVLPLAYEARVGGRLARFADGHNQRRAFAQEPYAQPKDRQPTTQAILDSRGFFGGGEGKENSEGWQELRDLIKKNLSEQSQADRKDAEQSSENKPE
jgi:hypothetical protein